LAIVQRPGKTRVLVEIACRTGKHAAQLRVEFGGTIEELGPNWLQQISRQAKSTPLRIGSRLIVSRTPIRQPKGRRIIVIPAEAAFGTGDHATTAMCLRMLERVTRNRKDRWTMLDAGTGSGVLAITASCFGAKRIIAIDNDPLACATAKRNARNNGVRNITVLCGDVLKQKFHPRFDIITANLFSEILIEVLPRWPRQLADEGRLILSGILREQEQSVVKALRKNGFLPLEIKRRGKWAAILAVRARKKS
jgi:ribosomal protein L11 methyltransferase